MGGSEGSEDGEEYNTQNVRSQLEERGLSMVGCDIQEYVEANQFNHNPRRPRKLLMHRRELDKLNEAATQKGHTIVATALYWKRHLVKCEVAIAKGKQLHDKRQTEKERDWNLQKQRIMQNPQ